MVVVYISCRYHGSLVGLITTALVASYTMLFFIARENKK